MTERHAGPAARLAILAGAIAIASALSACGDNKLGPSTPAVVAITAGSAQTLLVGNRPSAPLVVQVRNSDGATLPNIPVRWSVTNGGGSLTSVEDTTDANGNASTTYLSPAIVAKATVLAAAGGQGATFTMTLAPDTVGAISTYAGNGSAGLVGTSLTLVARATDRFGNAMRGITVNWSTTSGALQATTGVTDSTGKTSNVVTVGPDTGQVSVLATSRFNAVTFTVSALASP
jgi:hypothetical protein